MHFRCNFISEYITRWAELTWAARCALSKLLLVAGESFKVIRYHQISNKSKADNDFRSYISHYFRDIAYERCEVPTHLDNDFRSCISHYFRDIAYERCEVPTHLDNDFLSCISHWFRDIAYERCEVPTHLHDRWDVSNSQSNWPRQKLERLTIAWS